MNCCIRCIADMGALCRLMMGDSRTTGDIASVVDNFYQGLVEKSVRASRRTDVSWTLQRAAARAATGALRKGGRVKTEGEELVGG